MIVDSCLRLGNGCNNWLCVRGLVISLYRVNRRQRILGGKFKVVVDILQLLEVVFLQNHKAFQFGVESTGTVQTVNHMLLVL